MRCANASCHCQSEVFVEQDGKDYCSEPCASSPPGVAQACTCGHVGCSGSEEQSFAEGGPALREDASLPE